MRSTTPAPHRGACGTQGQLFSDVSLVPSSVTRAYVFEWSPRDLFIKATRLSPEVFTESVLTRAGYGPCDVLRLTPRLAGRLVETFASDPELATQLNAAKNPRPKVRALLLSWAADSAVVVHP